MAQLRKAERRKAKIRLGLSSVSGGGKTYSALLIAKGLVGEWSKVCVIDTENGSADLYSHLGEYNVITLREPFTPENYIDALKTAETAGMECIILDSITHEWDWCCEENTRLGGKFQDWAKVTPRHDKFKKALLSSTSHIITTVRRKQDYEMSKDSNGKVKVEKAGLKEQTREGWEYELTVNLELDILHNCSASKDRTGLFMGKPYFIPTEETGEQIRQWCETGIEVDANGNPKKDLSSDAALSETMMKWLRKKECEMFETGTEFSVPTVLKSFYLVKEELLPEAIEAYNNYKINNNL